jgi:hypothetical protein
LREGGGDYNAQACQHSILAICEDYFKQDTQQNSKGSQHKTKQTPVESTAREILSIQLFLFAFMGMTCDNQLQKRLYLDCTLNIYLVH